jgi:hypothetical protein
MKNATYNDLDVFMKDLYKLSVPIREKLSAKRCVNIALYTLFQFPAAWIGHRG